MLGVGVDGPIGQAEDRPALEWVTLAAGPRRLPAMDAQEREAWAALATVGGLGPAAFAVLLAHYGTARAVLDVALRPNGQRELEHTRAIDGIREPGRPALPIGPDVAQEIVAVAPRASTIGSRVRALELEVMTLDDPDYPRRLRQIHLPPAVLFVHGDRAALDRARATAVVGTRHPSAYGRTVATRIATALVAVDATVVSGLALGIDGAAHEATVRARGITVAVIGSGHGVLSPPSHRRLAQAIVNAGGAIVSELGPDVAPGPGTFPRRNRLISGLADATVVVEAPAQSGALLTAGWALDQGRQCFIVPGPIDAPNSAGCLSYLRDCHDEARIVTGIPQLIADLGYVPEAVPPRQQPVAAALQLLGQAESRIAEGVLAGRVTVDELVAGSGFTVATVLATLTLLERRGLVVGTYGRYRPGGALLEPPDVPVRR